MCNIKAGEKMKKKIMLIWLIISLKLFSLETDTEEIYNSLRATSLTFKECIYYDIDINNKMVPYKYSSDDFPSKIKLINGENGYFTIKYENWWIFKRTLKEYFAYKVVMYWDPARPVLAITRLSTNEYTAIYIDELGYTELTYELDMKKSGKWKLYKTRNKVILYFSVSPNFEKVSKYIDLSINIRKDNIVTNQELEQFKAQIYEFVGEDYIKEQLEKLYEELKIINMKDSNFDFNKNEKLSIDFNKGTVLEMQNDWIWDTRLWPTDENQQEFVFKNKDDQFSGFFSFKMGYTNRLFKFSYLIFTNANGDRVLKLYRPDTRETQKVVLNDFNNKNLNIKFNKNFSLDSKKSNHPVSLDFTINLIALFNPK